MTPFPSDDGSPCMNLREAADALHKLLAGHPSYRSTGIGASEIHVFTTKNARGLEWLPEIWNDWPLVRHAVGKFKAQAHPFPSDPLRDEGDVM